MNFNSLVWYSSLAIGDEKNSYVADFLNRSCELINEDINEEIKEKKLPINFKIDFLHIPKGEEGVNQLNDKLKNMKLLMLKTIMLSCLILPDISVPFAICLVLSALAFCYVPQPT